MPHKKPKTKEAKQRKFRKVMREFEQGELRTAAGERVKLRQQAIAIALRMSGQGKR